MPISNEQLQRILEAAIFVAGHPLSKTDMLKLFDENDQPETSDISAALCALQEKYHESGLELRELASGFQFQAKTELSPWLVKLWEERPKRYSRAFLETLALIAYRQPVTRSEIEEIRGVTVSSDIIKTLMEREWIKILGYKEVPGKPALYGTTKTFLDHFSIKSLDQLPTLAEIKDLESQEAKLHVQLELDQAISTENANHTDQSETADESEQHQSEQENADEVAESISSQALENADEVLEQEQENSDEVLEQDQSEELENSDEVLEQDQSEALESSDEVLEQDHSEELEHTDERESAHPQEFEKTEKTE